ncbi:MAG TPA: hypothetical protein ENI23_12075 [bacterium]|nr:hypothetical protein [bacterium]
MAKEAKEESMTVINVFFNENSSHSEVLEQIIKKLVDLEFASKNEIMETWIDILKVKILNKLKY